MKFESFIAKRYLLRKKKKSFVSLMSVVSIIGIAIGVASLIIALALINGFQKDIKNKILNSTAHLMISSRLEKNFKNYKELIHSLKKDIKDIKSITPVVFGTILIKSGNSSQGVILRGVDTKRLKYWKNKLIEGDIVNSKNEIIIGNEIALNLSIFCGENITAVIPRMTLSPNGLIPSVRRLKIKGIYKSGLYEFDNSTIITNLKNAQSLLKAGDKVSYIQIFLKNIFNAEKIKKKLQKKLDGYYSIITWKELNSSLYTALSLEKKVLFFTLTLIIIVAALNIIAGLFLLVFQKKKDIAILISYGAKPKNIQKIFFIQGSIIGITGTFVGALIGIIFCYLGNKFQLIKIPADIYQITHLSFKINPLDFTLVILVSLLISLFATYIPSKRAANINVIEAIKNE